LAGGSAVFERSTYVCVTLNLLTKDPVGQGPLSSATSAYHKSARGKHEFTLPIVCPTAASQLNELVTKKRKAHNEPPDSMRRENMLTSQPKTLSDEGCG